MPIGSMPKKNKGLVAKSASRAANRRMVRAAKRSSWAGGLGTGANTLASLPGQRGKRSTTRNHLI